MSEGVVFDDVDIRLPARPAVLAALSVLAKFVLVRVRTGDAALWGPSFSSAVRLLEAPEVTVQAWSEQAASLP